MSLIIRYVLIMFIVFFQYIDERGVNGGDNMLKQKSGSLILLVGGVILRRIWYVQLSAPFSIPFVCRNSSIKHMYWFPSGNDNGID